MARKSRYTIGIFIWRCPHCGFEHGAADVMRLDNKTMKCKGCSLVCSRCG